MFDFTEFAGHPYFSVYYALLPITFERAKVGKHLPGVIAPRTLANRNSLRNKALRKGDLEEANRLAPPCETFGGKAHYERDSFMYWLFKNWIVA